MSSKMVNVLSECFLLVGLSYTFGFPSSHMHGPSFLEEPSASLEFTNSSGATLNCLGQGNPTPQVRWIDLTNKEPTEIPRLREKLNNGSLYFWPFSLNEFRSEVHQTVYKCVLSNIVGSIVSRECKVRAEIVNPTDVQVSNVVVIKGNVAVMKCVLPMLTRSNQYSITWLKDDSKDERTIIMSGNKYTLTYSGELHVKDVNVQDSRTRFYCQLTCKLTGVRYFSQPGHITLTEAENDLKPKIEYSSSNVRAQVGDPVDLICSAQGYPPPVYRNNTTRFNALNPAEVVVSLEWLKCATDDNDRPKFQVYFFNPQPRKPLFVANVSATSPPVHCGHLIFVSGEGENKIDVWFHKVSGMLQEIRSGAAVFVRPQLSVLQFPRVQVSDSSSYVCIVSNKVGEDSRELKLTVFSSLIVFIRPQKLVIDSGSQAVFNCSVQGSTGDWSLYWLKNGDRIQESSSVEIINNAEILVLKNVDRKDSGMYQCFAQNHQETAQAAAELILGAVPPEFEDTFIEETIQPGQLVSLRCIANGNPPPRISWLLDGGQIQPIDGFFLGTFSDPKGNVVGHLNITSAKMEHGGLYSCIARNFLGSVQHSSMLNIYGPPTSRLPLNLTAVSATSIYLRCPVSGYPLTSVTWYFGGDLIISYENTRKLFPNGTLLLTHLEEEKDEGKFTCNVYNEQGTMSSGTIYLNIMAPPEIMPFHFSSNLKEGGKTNIVCSVTSGDLPITFTWRKDGKPLPHDPDVHEHVMDMVSTLRINNLAAKHSGHYTCIATNPASSANFTAKLIVKASPTWSVEPQDTTVLHPHSAIINCQANGFPFPRVLWTKAKENKPNDFIPLESNSRLFIYGNGSVEIKNAERQHEGFYTCQADNGIGNSIAKTVFLKVNIPAHFRTKSFNLSGVAGRNVVLTCEAEGDFPIRITWSSIANSAIYTKQTSTSAISELHLDRLSREHAGIYRCTASNSFGYDHTAIILAIKEPPEPPKNVRILESGSRWLQLNWTVENKDSTHFIIQYRPMHESNWYNFTIPNSFENYKIEALVPNTMYIIKVIAVNEIGRSRASLDVTARTLQEVPSGYPMDITVEKVSTDSITVKWKVLSPEYWNGELLGYRIYFLEYSRASNSRSRTTRNIDANKMTLKNLRSYVTYDISIRAFNQIGEGPSSPSLTVTTLESIPTSAPQHVECSPLSPESIRVRWRPPAQHWNGVLQSYKLSYQPSNPKPGVRVYIEYKKTPNLEFTIHGLEKYTNYSVRVSASTNTGDGVASPRIQCFTMEDVPGAPNEIKALVLSSDSILVVWTAPKEPGGKIIKYNIYMQSDNEAQRKETVLGESSKKFEFRRLAENRRYEFWITASTAIGEGQSSIKVTRTLSSKVPPKISSFSRAVVGIANSHLTLDCNAVGLPTPTRVWKKFNNMITSPDIKVLLDKSLWIPELKTEDSGNYTCLAENVFGHDKISYEVIVVSVPLPPLLQFVSASQNSVTLKWRDSSDGGCPILGYVINVRLNNEEFSIHIDQDKSTNTVLNLKCGTKYQFSIQALNSVGLSNQSNVVNEKTKGDVPEVYNEQELFFVNSTNLLLFLDGWPERECAIQYFTVSYRLGNNWISVGKGNLMAQHITVSDLIPASLYTFRIGAFNEAGKIYHNFVITTRSLTGEVIPVESIEQSKISIITQLNLIIPLISGIVCLISVSVCVVILLRRKKLYNEYKSEETTLKNGRVELENPQNVHRPQMHPQENVYSPSHVIHKTSGLRLEKDDYDVYPYATFTVPNQLQTFAPRDCTERILMTDNGHSLQRKRRNSSLSNTLNLEAACHVFIDPY